jgi:hypothetical protein
MNVLLVENPAIYLNCREAMAVLGISAADSVLIVTSIIRKNLMQLRAEIDPAEWAAVHFPTVDTRVESVIAAGLQRTVLPRGRLANLLSQRSNVRRIKDLAVALPSVDTVICGVYANEMALTFCATTKYARYILVDDGNMTMFTAKGRSAETSVGHKHVLGVNSISRYRGVVGQIKLLIKRILIGVRDRGVPAVTFFTAHHDIDCRPPDSIIANHYSSYLRKPEDQVVHEGLVHILGAPFLERNILSEADFITLLSEVFRRYGHQSIVYFPHRMETERSLHHVRSVLKTAEILRPDVPYEGHIGVARDLPMVIASFYSSALTNLLAMDLAGVCIHVVRFPWQRVVEPTKAELVRTIYEKLAERQSERLKVVEVDLSSTMSRGKSPCEG